MKTATATKTTATKTTTVRSTTTTAAVKAAESSCPKIVSTRQGHNNNCCKRKLNSPFHNRFLLLKLIPSAVS